MREAIERVIIDLEQKLDAADKGAKEAADEGSLYREGVCAGRGVAYSSAINQLKAVLANGENNSSRVQGNDGQAQEQIPGGKDDG